MPDVPVPAPAKISPVGFSSTFILIILLFLFVSDSCNSASTEANIPLDLILLIDLLKSISLYASPSSTIKEFLITFSSVIKFPKILILSTKDFSNSSK